MDTPFRKHSFWFGASFLLCSTLIWGATFVAQSTAMRDIGPFTFLVSRFVLACLVLGPVSLVGFRRRRRLPGARGTPVSWRPLVLGAALCSLTLLAALASQQCGISGTTVGKAGFISSMYIVIVPFFGVFLGRRIGAFEWLGVALAATGLYFMSMSGGNGLCLGRGDSLMLVCAVASAFHIMVVDKFAPQVHSIDLVFMQFLMMGAVCAVPMLLFERPSLPSLRAAAPSILYAGIAGSGLAYTLQAVGQRYTRPQAASLIFSLEAVFAALFAWLLLSETPTSREFIGMALMVAALLSAQIPPRSHRA